MRFREDLKAYYFSTNHETDSEERSIIYEQTKDYLKEYLHTTFKPADTTGGTVKKFLPIVIFAIAVVLLIIFSINKMIPALIFTFGGVFILFGIAFFLPGNKDEETPELPQHSKVPKAIPGAAIIAFGLGVIVPAVFAPSIGYAKAMVQRAIDLARANGMKAIRLDVLEGNIPAENLYIGFGFQYMATLKMYYEDTGWTNFRLYEYVI